MENACPTIPLSEPPGVDRRAASEPPSERGTDVDPWTLRAAQSGDPRATELFVRHYQTAVFAFISRSVGRGSHVEDLAQEVFLRVIRALPRFERREAKVSTWIFQIAVRLIQDQKRRRHRDFVPITEELGDGRPSPEQSCARRRLLSRVETLVERLPPDQRITLVLSEFHDMSHAEIAEAMNVSPKTVKTRLHRARTFLRESVKRPGRSE